MGGGTWCELTKKNRRIEVQFQCDPSGGDRIAWIRETSTCSYLMVIHTPKLCNDLAFVPVKRVGEGEGVHDIVCQKVAKAEIETNEGQKQQVLELPSGAAESLNPTKTTKTPDETHDNPNSADFLEFIIPIESLPSASRLLKETILQQIEEGKFLRPDGRLYNPEDEDAIEYLVELVDDEEDRIFGLLHVKISKGAKVETEIIRGDGSRNSKEDALPERLRKELNDWVEGRVVGAAENAQA